MSQVRTHTSCARCGEPLTGDIAHCPSRTCPWCRRCSLPPRTRKDPKS